MKLLAPVNSVESAIKQITSGANEIYLGLKPEVFSAYSFSGRGQASRSIHRIELDKEEFKEIVNKAHDNSVEVCLAANSPMFSEFHINDMEQRYLDMVEEAVKSGVDNIIVGDIGLLKTLSKLELPAKLHASTYFDTMSISQVEFLRELGASRVCLTYQAHIDEIQKIVNSGLIEVEVFGFMGCSFFNGACNFVHDMGEDKGKAKTVVGVHCKSLFEVYENGKYIGEEALLDSSLACGLCSLKRLSDIGVDVIKIGGRDQHVDFAQQVTALFHEAMNYTGYSEKEYMCHLEEIKYSWWKRLYCEHTKCKYVSNCITESYIGVK